MSTLTVNTIQKIGGGRHSRVSYSTLLSTIVSNITWHTSFNATTQNLGAISGATSPDVIAIEIAINYMHNGSTNHGYLTGWYHQTGKTYNTQGVYNWQSHYDWYYNVFDTYLVIPWDPTGTQSLSIYVTDAFNTSTNNRYNIYHTKVFSQAQ